jgi:hypothetical protein
MPDVTCHTKVFDDYLPDPRVEYHATAKNEKICFHDPVASDPDWKVKQSYILHVVASSEMEDLAENL